MVLPASVTQAPKSLPGPAYNSWHFQYARACRMRVGGKLTVAGLQRYLLMVSTEAEEVG